MWGASWECGCLGDAVELLRWLRCVAHRDAGDALLQAMDNFDFSEAWDEAMAGRNFILAPAVQHELAERVRKHLTKVLKPAKAKAA